LKRVDLAVLQAFRGVQPGVTVLGLKEGALDYALDEHNAQLITPAMRQRVDAAKADIVAGKLRVIDSSVTGQCR
jgi:basic membrane protein A and related proteins